MLDVVVIALPLLCTVLGPLLPAPIRPPQRRALRALPIAIFVFAIPYAVIRWRERDRSLLTEAFPVPVVRFLEREGIRGRPLNHVRNGGYLGWALQAPIFIDGRNIVFAGLAREVWSNPLERTVERYGIDFLLLTPFELEKWHVKPDPAGWAVVYWDDLRAVYLPRRAPYLGVIARHEYRLVPPFDAVEPGLLASRENDAAVRQELERVVAQSRSTQRAYLILSSISRMRGEFGRAKHELEAAQAVRPSAQIDAELAKVTARLEALRRGPGRDAGRVDASP
jgi:hypothetical protein